MRRLPDQIFATGQQPEADVLGLQLQLQTCSCKNQTLRSGEVWHPPHPCICHFSFDILVFYVAIQYLWTISFYHRHSTVFTKEKKRKSADEERKEKERRKEKWVHMTDMYMRKIREYFLHKPTFTSCAESIGSWESEVIQAALKPLSTQNMTAGTCTRKCRRDLMWLNRSFPTLVSRFLPTRLPSPVTL